MLIKRVLFLCSLFCTSVFADGIYVSPVSLPVSVLNGGTGVTTSTGTGSVVLSTAPTVSNGLYKFNTGAVGTSSDTYISGNGSGRLLLNAPTGQEIDLSINGSTVQYITSSGIGIKGISFIAANPTVSSCGTSPSVDANSSNYAGKVTAGSVAASSCTVTFATAFSTYNHCRITSQSTIASFAYTYTLSAITVTGTSLVGDVFDYACDGV
jgi:hypothetical protein